MQNSYKKNVRVLIIETAIQRPSFDRARPNGNLGPAYLIGALRNHGVEVDYLDATVGNKISDLQKTFYHKEELENGLIRFGMSADELPEIFSNYDIIATSSIFSAQTRMQFEVASIAKKVSKQNGKEIVSANTKNCTNRCHENCRKVGDCAGRKALPKAIFLIAERMGDVNIA